MEAIKKTQTTHINPPPPPPNQKGLLPLPANFQRPGNLPSNQTQLNPKTLTPAERAEKLAKGLCFCCDQPYERGHKCNIKKTQLFLIKIPGQDDEEEDMVEVEELDEDECDFYKDNPQISVHALSGNQNFQTMRVTAYMGGLLCIYSLIQGALIIS